ncbi:pilus assembly protein [Oligoflexia bacterium]|nr:pilus assembly protein [Oligoflexia bacterium]
MNKFSGNRHNKLLRFSRSSSGAVMAELAIAIPFLVILLTGFLAFGRILAQASKVSNASYHVAVEGSDATTTTGANEMQARKATFDYQFVKDVNGFSLNSEYQTPYAGATPVPVVRAQLSGSMISLQNVFVSLPFSTSIVAAHMEFGKGLLSKYGDYGLLKGKLFDCDFEECGGNTGNSCPQAPCTNVSTADPYQ